MKRILCGVLALVLSLTLAGCEPSKESNDDYLSSKEAINQLIISLNNDRHIVDIGAEELDKFMTELDKITFRVCGMATDVETYQDYLNDRTVMRCSLTDGKTEISVYFKDIQSITNGEYIEVLGELLGSGSALNNATISDRGKSVEEKLDK